MFLVLELCKGGELLALLKTKGHFTEEVYTNLKLCVCVCVCAHARVYVCACMHVYMFCIVLSHGMCDHDSLTVNERTW